MELKDADWSIQKTFCAVQIGCGVWCLWLPFTKSPGTFQTPWSTLFFCVCVYIYILVDSACNKFGFTYSYIFYLFIFGPFFYSVKQYRGHQNDGITEMQLRSKQVLFFLKFFIPTSLSATKLHQNLNQTKELPRLWLFSGASTTPDLPLGDTGSHG